MATSALVADGIERAARNSARSPHDANASDDYYLDEQAYVLSYNPDKRVPNWVAWRLDRSYLGTVRRRDDFRADLSLPAIFGGDSV